MRSPFSVFGRLAGRGYLFIDCIRTAVAALGSGQHRYLSSLPIAVCDVQGTQIPLLLLGRLVAQFGRNLTELPRPFLGDRGAATQIGADPSVDHRRRSGRALPRSQAQVVRHDKRGGVAKKLGVMHEIGYRFHGTMGLPCQADPT